MKLKCVIIDDEPPAHRVIEKYIGKHSSLDYVGSYYNAIDALSFLASEEVDIIFLDINMPIMDGWAFLDEFIKLPNTSGVHIKIITSSIDIRDRQKWKDYMKKTGHQIDFITKPIYELNLEDVTHNMGLAS